MHYHTIIIKIVRKNYQSKRDEERAIRYAKLLVLDFRLDKIIVEKTHLPSTHNDMGQFSMSLLLSFLLLCEFIIRLRTR